MPNKKSTKLGLITYSRFTPVKLAEPKKRARTKELSAEKASIKTSLTGLSRHIFTVPKVALKLVWAVCIRIFIVLVLIIVGGIAYQYNILPDAAAVLDGRARGSVTMLNRYGEIFAWRGEQYSMIVSADSVSRHLRNAIIATEDRRFFHHVGVSPRGIASAIRINIHEGRGPFSGHGGSTITQQVAKLICLGKTFKPNIWKNEAQYEQDCRENSLWRKIREAIFSLAMEAKYSKDEILTIYLNRAFLGAGARGFEAASQRYFGKSAAQVSLAESAMLAGLLVAPTRYAPTNDLTRSQNRAAVIIGLMRAQNYISSTEAKAALEQPAILSKAANARAGGYFADWVMSSGPEFFTRKTTEDVVIKTTLDQRIQIAAETALFNVFRDKVYSASTAQAAIIVMSPDGAVRAMVGGREQTVAGVFNRATQAKRQTGSTFKPFVYAAALKLGYRHTDHVEDLPLTLQIPGSGNWTPQNHSKTYRGVITLIDALAESRNIPAVQISESVGRENVRNIASDFGIDSALADGPALALGASEATLIEMVGAYAGILNGGSSVVPYGLVELRFKNSEEAMMDADGGIGGRVLRETVAQELVFMLHRVVEQGTGQRAAMEGIEVAGKTGTTQAARDAWFIGFTADYVAGVWIGHDNNAPLTGVTGSGLPAEIWRETMAGVYTEQAARPLPMLRPVAVPSKPQVNPKAYLKDIRITHPSQNETRLKLFFKKIFGPN